jgi:hypothetical protein
MNFRWLVAGFACCSLPFCTPRPQAVNSCFQGRLVKKGICGQRVIELVGAGTGLAAARHWRDSLSGKDFENVFTVANPCDFPATVQQGDTFEFRLTRTPGGGCVQCYAYTPVPAEKNNILIGCVKQQ